MCRPVPEGEVDQFGWRGQPGEAADTSANGFRNPYDRFANNHPRGHRERDTTLDYQTADLEKACLQQMRRKKGVGLLYSWDAWHGKCLYMGVPARYKKKKPKTRHPLTDGKYWDLIQDCRRRGPQYSYQYPWRDGEPGTCLKRGVALEETRAPPRYGALDYLKMDLRNMCKARKWVWRNGRCGPKALSKRSSASDARKFEKMAGTVDQRGWHEPEPPKGLPPDTPVTGFPVHQTVDSALINDYITECTRHLVPVNPKFTACVLYQCKRSNTDANAPARAGLSSIWAIRCSVFRIRAALWQTRLARLALRSSTARRPVLKTCTAASTWPARRAFASISSTPTGLWERGGAEGRFRRWWSATRRCRSRTRYSVDLLYWYKSTNTDTAHARI